MRPETLPSSGSKPVRPAPAAFSCTGATELPQANQIVEKASNRVTHRSLGKSFLGFFARACLGLLLLGITLIAAFPIGTLIYFSLLVGFVTLVYTKKVGIWPEILGLPNGGVFINLPTAISLIGKTYPCTGPNYETATCSGGSARAFVFSGSIVGSTVLLFLLAYYLKNRRSRRALQPDTPPS